MVKGRENVTVIYPFLHTIIMPVAIHNAVVQTKLYIHFSQDKRQTFTLTLTLFGLLDQNSVTAVGSGSDTNVSLRLISETLTEIADLHQSGKMNSLL